jgi:hypothetical protein
MGLWKKFRLVLYNDAWLAGTAPGINIVIRH